MASFKKIKVFFSDKRGVIKDIFFKEIYDHCAYVSFTKNAVRGNHYHKKSIQSSYILEGNFKVFSSKINRKTHSIQKKISSKKVTKGTFVTHAAYEAHTYKCLSKKGILIVFTKGIRGGVNYEKDTFRLRDEL
tara:strand:- start:9508 stop:9906 length:399 start_codon:yes stop_codon:yes gene_type:complete